jgi:hypothetical protein
MVKLMVLSPEVVIGCGGDAARIIAPAEDSLAGTDVPEHFESLMLEIRKLDLHEARRSRRIRAGSNDRDPGAVAACTAENQGHDR